MPRRNFGKRRRAVWTRNSLPRLEATVSLHDKVRCLVSLAWRGALLVVLVSLAIAFYRAPFGLTFPAPLEAEHLLILKAFHIVGAPGVKRNRRVDLDLTAQSLIVRQQDQERLNVPFTRLRRLQVLNGKRTYAKATYAAVLGLGLGGLLVLNKNKPVDTLVFDFMNERGGEMGLILQVPQGRGADCIQWLRRYGIPAEEPDPLPAGLVGGPVP